MACPYESCCCLSGLHKATHSPLPPLLVFALFQHWLIFQKVCKKQGDNGLLPLFASYAQATSSNYWLYKPQHYACFCT